MGDGEWSRCVPHVQPGRVVGVRTMMFLHSVIVCVRCVVCALSEFRYSTSTWRCPAWMVDWLMPRVLESVFASMISKTYSMLYGTSMAPVPGLGVAWLVPAWSLVERNTETQRGDVVADELVPLPARSTCVSKALPFRRLFRSHCSMTMLERSQHVTGRPRSPGKRASSIRSRTVTPWQPGCAMHFALHRSSDARS